MPVVACAALLVASGCGSWFGDKAGSPDIVLITIDALRADHLGCYGYSRPTSPFIDSLCGEGAVFLNCSSPVSWTRPAMASLMTGLYPRRHGVYTTDLIDRAGTRWPIKIDPKFVTLAEILKENGYKTIGITSNPQAGIWSGTQQGFDVFIDFKEGLVDAAKVHQAALKIKDELDTDQPIFFWVHYLDPHAPYTPQEPWIDRYESDRSLIDDPLLSQNAFEEDFAQAAGLVKDRPEYVRVLNALYDSEINYVDDYVRRLIEEVLPPGRKLLILTSDHGEEFRDHGRLVHGQTLFQESVHIPLIISDPEGKWKGKKISVPASLNDVYATVIDYLGISGPYQLDGHSLLPLLEGEVPDEERVLFAELEEEESPHLDSVKAGGFKLVRDIKDGRQQNLYLFDLENDPKERENLLDSRPEVCRRLEFLLRSWKQENPKFEYNRREERWPAGEVEKLKALGYLQ